MSRSPRPDREGHSGEWETALALHCFPDLVDRKILGRLEPNFDYDVAALRDETSGFRALSDGRGYFGSPAAGCAETGRGLVAVRGRNIAGAILKALGAPEGEVV